MRAFTVGIFGLTLDLFACHARGGCLQGAGIQRLSGSISRGAGAVGQAA